MHYPMPDQLAEQLRAQGLLDEDKYVEAQKKNYFLKSAPELLKISLVSGAALSTIMELYYAMTGHILSPPLMNIEYFGFMFAMTSLLAFIACYNIRRKDLRILYLYNLGTETPGIITKITDRGVPYSRRSNVEYRKFYYSYNAYSQYQIFDIADRAIRVPAEGNTVTVYYDPNNPENSAILCSRYKDLLIKKSL